MKFKFNEVAFALGKTILILILLEVFNTAFLPAIGLMNLKLAFSVLIVLFMAFKLETPFLPFLILVVQYIHSIFSIEGWAAGTLVGIIISVSVRYIRDLLNFGTAISTIIVVQIFQVVWFALIAFILSLKMATFGHFFHIFAKSLPETFILSILSPVFFAVFDRLWKVDKAQSGVIV